MMGLGSLGNGGGSSSSFSNLSPLAPPFTVDRSNSKPNSNPLVNFSDSHYTFGQSWQYATADPSADSVPLSPPVYSPSGGSVNPSNTLWSTSNPTAKTSTEGYSFGCEGYYSPYVSPIVNTDSPLMAFNETSTNSGNSNPVNVSSQVDYTQSLSGLEYPVSHWNSWSQMGNGKQDERKGVDGSFSLGQVNAGTSFLYRNCISQGNSLEGVNKAVENSCALSGSFTDRMYTGPSSKVHLDDKSYLTQEPVYQSFNSNTASMGSNPPVSCQAGHSLGSSKNYSNYENPFTPHDKFFQPLDSCLRDTTSTSKSSPAVVIRPAPSGNSVLAQKTNSHKTVDICKPGASNSEKSDFCDLLKSEETRLPIGSPVQGLSLDTRSPNFGKDIKDTIVFASLSITNQCSSYPLVSSIPDITAEAGSGSQAPYSSAPAATFTENFSDALDLHNPYEDSPCWKGAPASRISLSDSVEAPSLKNKVEYSDFGQSNPLFPPAEHSGRTSSKKFGEDNLHNDSVYAGIGLSVPSGGSGTTKNVTGEVSIEDVAEENFEQRNLSNSSKVLKFSEDLNKPSKEYDLPRYLESDSQVESSCGKLLNVDEHKYGPTKRSLDEGFKHSGLNLNDALEDGVVARDAAEKVLRSPSSQEDAKQAYPYNMGSSLKLDVPTLVNAIYNLSELLKSQCLTNVCLLEEQDHYTLEHAISNLGACTAKKIDIKEAISQHGAFEKSQESCGSYMGTGTGHPHFVEEITDSCRLGYQPMHEGKSKGNGKEAENSPLITPFKDDLGDSKEELVAQAIKKVLSENFLCDEEMQPQALLFKNLWLEAEAKLCSISYKARFERMKIEMEKHKVNHQTDLNLKSSVVPEAENDLASETTTQSPSTSRKSVRIEDSEDSVMERFNILNRREEKLIPTLMKGENGSTMVTGDAEDSVTMRLNSLRQPGNNSSSSFMEEKKASDRFANDAEGSVLERLNILRQRGENLKRSFMEERRDQDVTPNDAGDSVMDRFNILRQRGEKLNSSFMEEEKDEDVVASDAEDSVMGRLNMVRQRGDNLNSSFIEEKKDPDMVAENSAMARFNILKHRGDNLKSPCTEFKNDLDMVAAGSPGIQEKLGLLNGEVSEDKSPNVVIEPYFYYQSVDVGEGKLGSYGDGSGYDSMKQFLLSVADDPIVHSNWKSRLGNQQSSGLYDNSSSDWEHVVKDEFV